jgi:hypothetical protein
MGAEVEIVQKSIALVAYVHEGSIQPLNDLPDFAYDDVANRKLIGKTLVVELNNFFILQYPDPEPVFCFTYN